VDNLEVYIIVPGAIILALVSLVGYWVKRHRMKER